MTNNYLKHCNLIKYYYGKSLTHYYGFSKFTRIFKPRKIIISISISFLFLILPLGRETISAQTSGITISPEVIYIQSSQNNIHKEITISNNSNKQVSIAIEIYEFEPTGNFDGTIFLKPSPVSITNTNLHRAISFSTDNSSPNIIIQPNSQFTGTLNIDSSLLASGDYYFSIVAEQSNEQSEANIHLGAVSNVLLTVGSSITDIEITKIETNILHSGDKITLSAKIQNNAQNFTTVTPVLKIYNLFGKVIYEEQLEKKVILERGMRYITQHDSGSEVITVTDAPPLFGIYTIEIEASGKKNTTTIITLPLLIITLTIVSLITIISIYLRVKRKI